MSMTEEEAQQEEYLSRLYEEFRPEAIDEFKSERLQAYYLANAWLAKPAVDVFDEARQLPDYFRRARLILAYSAVEIAFKSLLLRPIVAGLVHSPATASVVADMVTSQQGWDRILGPLTQILNDISRVDLSLFQRAEQKILLKAELAELGKTRNAAVHRGEDVSEKECQQGLGVAACVLEDLFPRIMKEIGLHIHHRVRLCDKWYCKYTNK